MGDTAPTAYFRGRWPDAEVPPGEPLWLHYEIDFGADAVLRSVDVFADGCITRNSIELEQRHGDACPSLIDCSLDEGFARAKLEEIPRETFEALWDKGVDTPFWFPR
jgi:hypothetical protein